MDACIRTSGLLVQRYLTCHAISVVAAAAQAIADVTQVNADIKRVIAEEARAIEFVNNRPGVSGRFVLQASRD